MFYKNGDLEIEENKKYVIYCDRGLYIGMKEHHYWYIEGLYHCDVIEDSEVLYICEIYHESLEMIKNVK